MSENINELRVSVTPEQAMLFCLFVDCLRGETVESYSMASLLTLIKTLCFVLTLICLIKYSLDCL